MPEDCTMAVNLFYCQIMHALSGTRLPFDYDMLGQNFAAALKSARVPEQIRNEANWRGFKDYCIGCGAYNATTEHANPMITITAGNDYPKAKPETPRYALLFAKSFMAAVGNGASTGGNGSRRSKSQRTLESRV